MNNNINKLKDVVSGDQLADILSVYATAINSKVPLDLSYRILLQLCAYYLIPEWTYKEGGYKKDEVVRCQGRLFQAKADTTTSPYIAIDDGNGNIVVDDNWNILTTDKVDEENWAHVLGGAPEFNLIQQIANLREENERLHQELNERIARIEQFLYSHILITE